jgi:predicted metal-dependent phosphoesterase TrpH
MSKEARCDLHLHTHCSDGALPPRQLIELAHQQGLRTLALTDHDTLDGVPAAAAAGRELGIDVIPGIELSVLHAERDLHLLGYFITAPRVLEDVLQAMVESRLSRAHAMVQRLTALGLPIEFEAVRARARGRIVGRPHVAEELVARGYVPDTDTAFERWIGDGAPACIPKSTLGLAEGAALLRAAGGVTSLAHPHVYGIGSELIAQLAGLGVTGLEVWHPSHDAATTEKYLGWATQHGLVATGGSDFHRPAPGGILPGDLGVTREQLERLRARVPA